MNVSKIVQLIIFQETMSDPTCEVYLQSQADESEVQIDERQAYWKHVENIIDLGDPEADYRPSKQKRF